MELMLVLRLTMDLCIYYAFVGVLMPILHGQMFYTIVPLLCLVYALNYRVMKRWFRYLSFVVCFIACYMEGLEIYGCMAILPMVVYTFQLVHQHNYDLSWGVVVSRFVSVCIAYGVSAFVMFLFNQSHLFVKYSLPFGLAFILSMVLLMRSLRHDEVVYTSARYQLINIGIVLVIVAVALLLSLDVVRAAMWYVVHCVYAYIVLPVLMGIMYVMMYGMKIIFWLFSFANADTSLLNEVDFDFDLQTSEQTFDDFVMGNYRMDFMVMVLLFIGCLMIFALFRYLSKRTLKEENAIKMTSSRLIESNRNDMQHKVSGYELQVRKQYKRFLRFYESLGQVIPTYQTTKEIEYGAKRYVKDKEQLSSLRNLYLKARYHQGSSKEDGAYAKTLVKEILKQHKQD